MKILGSKCGGCCGQACTDCCTVNAPSTFEVDVQFTDDECGVCDSFLSGVYSMNRVSPGTQCVWDFSQGNDNSNLAFCDSGCTDEATCYYIIRRQVRLDITKRAGVCYLHLQVLVCGRYYPSEPGNPCNTSFGAPYRKFCNLWEFTDTLGSVTDCTTISGKPLTLTSSSCSCLHGLSSCDPSFMHWLCDPSTITATLSAR